MEALQIQSQIHVNSDLPEFKRNFSVGAAPWFFGINASFWMNCVNLSLSIHLNVVVNTFSKVKLAREPIYMSFEKNSSAELIYSELNHVSAAMITVNQF